MIKSFIKGMLRPIVSELLIEQKKPTKKAIHNPTPINTRRKRQVSQTLYQLIAEKHGVTARYVGKIARSERTPTKKKGLKVYNELQSHINQ